LTARRITASRLDLAATCPGSHALPWVGSVSDAATNGTEVHAFTERALLGDVAGALEMVPENLRHRCAEIDVPRLRAMFGPDLRAEVKVAYDPIEDRAVEIEAPGTRDYESAPEGWITGTIDALSLDPVVVADWKSGKSWHKRPRENWQIRFAAVAASRLSGNLDNGATGIVGKILDDGGLYPVADPFDEFDLDAAAVGLKAVATGVRQAQADVAASRLPRLVTGQHCRFCPAFASCPAQVGAAQAMVPLSQRLATLTPAEAGELVPQVLAAEAAVAKAKEALQELARREPLPLPNGKVWVPLEQEATEIDPTHAVKALVAEGVPLAIAASSVTATISQDSIKAALKKAEAKRGTFARLMRRLEANGAARKKPWRTIYVERDPE
jgi:hypothetical protein